MNREERRALAKVPKQAIDSMLSESYELGKGLGMDKMNKHSVSMLLAAMCLVLHKNNGFTSEQCLGVLKDVEEVTINALTNVELLQEVKELLGIELKE